MNWRRKVSVLFLIGFHSLAAERTSNRDSSVQAAEPSMTVLVHNYVEIDEHDAASVKRNVTVCVEDNAGSVGAQARSLAGRMFAAIGLTIEWYRGLRGCPSQAIRISLLDRTPASLKPDALAYALPYEGTHIGVFYDRIVAAHPKARVPTVLGHVLVHEITHILQGSNEHSDNGIMKARWEPKDYADMAWKPLGFTKKDIDLIYRGLAARQARLSANPR